jgi:O-antigen ligase
MQERWPYFWNKVLNNPWLGYGDDWDPALGEEGMDTPHNGYLALAVRSGLPALALFVTCVLTLIRKNVSILRRSRDQLSRCVALGSLAATVALCVHNVGDATFEVGMVGYTFWIMYGLAMVTQPEERKTSGESKDDGLLVGRPADRSERIARAGRFR